MVLVIKLKILKGVSLIIKFIMVVMLFVIFWSSVFVVLLVWCRFKFRFIVYVRILM